MPPIAPARSGRRALQAILFDMDGLLVDSEPLWFEVESEIMTHLGGQWNPADQRALMGGSLDRTVDYLLSRATRAAAREEVGRWLVDGMTALLRERGAAVLPGARELLAEVTDAGMPHALVTSSERQIMEAAIPKIGMNFGATHAPEFVAKMAQNGVLFRGLEVMGGGSILTGLVLGAIAVFVIDRKFINASAFALAGAVLTYFGFMHGDAIGIGGGFGVTPSVALAYLIVAGFLFTLARAPALVDAPARAAAVPAE